MTKQLLTFAAISLLACSICSVSTPNVSADETAERQFTLKVLPLLKDKCWGCHGGDEGEKGDFSVIDRESLLRGGESGEPAIVPGAPEKGLLIKAIAWEGYEMPPKENDRLTDEQVQLFREWIKKGAPWPDEKTQARIRKEEAKRRVTNEGMIIDTSGGASAEWTNRRYAADDLWAFMPVRAVSDLLPESIDPTDAVDYFIDRRLDEAGLEASEPAEPRDLIRRATYDLTGLSPSPAEVANFIEACQAEPERAWKKLLDRLLDSPRYGEHWARHWFDVTRYADTGGMSNDYERSNMWRYRDYVIRAFNNDKPYNEFIIEQLAGDELADESFRERTGASQKEVYQAQLNGDYNASEAEWIVATGFLRMGPWDNAMVKAEEARQIYLDDLVNITGQTFLSQTLRCCKCHDHKFDPIPTRDYYRIYFAFSTTQIAERSVPFLPQEELRQSEEGRAHVQRMLDFAVSEKNKILEKQEAAARAWYEEHGLSYKTEGERRNDPDEMKPPRHVGLNHVEQGQLKVREQDEWIWRRRLERYEPMAQSVYNSATFHLAWNGARKLRISRKTRNTSPPENHILLGGALTALGDRVFPGVLSAAALTVSNSDESPYLLTKNVDGRRLELARWIARPDNPLATRSIVNRIWQSHFGKGIAANTNNFGAKGAKPSHPELLDFLASDFVDGDWSIKRMHRRIMMSEAYRRSCTAKNAEKAATVDPNNALLSHCSRQRLTAEQLRDSILAATGELVHSAGGPPVMPEINMEVALQPRMIQFSLAPAYQPSPTPAMRNRRTVYAYHVRGQADPFTELFNQPGPNESCEARESAAATPQVFALLNSDLITDRSIAMARRLQSEKSSLDARLHKQESKLSFGQEKGFKFFVGSPFQFRKVGSNGIEMCDQWKHLADPYVADELCNYRGCQAESLNHPEALFHMNTGSRLGGDPAVGAWVNYGLGAENQNLPGYVVMTELALPQGGPANWSNGFLPPSYQGTRLRPQGSPILDLASQPFKSREHQRRALDELAWLNEQHLNSLDESARPLQSRMENYELAFRMQTEVPGVIDLAKESDKTQSMYGLDDADTKVFGRQCLMARRLVENGVRFVQIFSGGWDSHDYLERGHSARIKSVDKPIAALIRDLKQRGMLEDTLVIWTGEFGRTPDNNKRGGVYSLGRGHNSQAMTMLFAGGGVKPGVVGATDELGSTAVECVHPIRDLHVTLLRLLGLDDNKLTYFHAGRYKQLSQFGGEVIQELIA